MTEITQEDWDYAHRALGAYELYKQYKPMAQEKFLKRKVCLIGTNCYTDT